MALSITSSNFLNGDWILECQIDLPNDRQMVQDLLQMINPGLAVPQCPIGIPFTAIPKRTQCVNHDSSRRARRS